MHSNGNIILDLQRKVTELQEENDYLKSSLYMFEICQIIKREYSILLNPPEFQFTTTKSQKSCSFKININDIVCVISEGKTKWIYFQEPQSSVEGIRHISNRLSYTGSLEDFCLQYDRPKIHLCQISRSVIVNLFFYYLDRSRVMLINTKNFKKTECNNLAIGKIYISNFIERKASLKNIISFQKIDFQGNYNYESNKLNSFES
jgi:hypothetical protein